MKNKERMPANNHRLSLRTPLGKGLKSQLVRTVPALLLLSMLACHSSRYPAGQTYNRIQVDSTAAPDSALVQTLLPYKQRLDRVMNEVLTRTTAPINKEKPEGPLNNLLTDALLGQASQKLGRPVDCSHLNYYGVRSNLPRGPISIGSIFEVMPFDNQLVVLTLKGDGLLQLFNHFAEHDEALLVGGVRVTIHDKKVQSVTFNNGRPFRPDQTYTVALSDYVANGGSDAGFLKTTAVRREDLNYLIRDAFIDFFRQQGKSGQPLTPTTDGRITIQ